MQALANMYKLFFGIAIVAYPQSVSWVGLGLSSAALIVLTLCSTGSSYFLLKARNKYSDKQVRDLADLGEICYGPYMRVFCQFILVLS